MDENNLSYVNDAFEEEKEAELDVLASVSTGKADDEGTNLIVLLATDDVFPRVAISGPRDRTENSDHSHRAAQNEEMQQQTGRLCDMLVSEVKTSAKIVCQLPKELVGVVKTMRKKEETSTESKFLLRKFCELDVWQCLSKLDVHKLRNVEVRSSDVLMNLSEIANKLVPMVTDRYRNLEVSGAYMVCIKMAQTSEEDRQADSGRASPQPARLTSSTHVRAVSDNFESVSGERARRKAPNPAQLRNTLPRSTLRSRTPLNSGQ